MGLKYKNIPLDLFETNYPKICIIITNYQPIGLSRFYYFFHDYHELPPDHTQLDFEIVSTRNGKFGRLTQVGVKFVVKNPNSGLIYTRNGTNELQ